MCRGRSQERCSVALTRRCQARGPGRLSPYQGGNREGDWPSGAAGAGFRDHGRCPVTPLRKCLLHQRQRPQHSSADVCHAPPSRRVSTMSGRDLQFQRTPPGNMFSPWRRCELVTDEMRRACLTSTLLADLRNARSGLPRMALRREREPPRPILVRPPDWKVVQAVCRPKPLSATK